MKKIITAIAIALTLLNAAQADIYPDTMLVVDVDRTNDTVTVEAYNGNRFAFYGCEDWMVGEIASLIMDDNCTDLTCDDIVLDARFSGLIRIGY